MEIIYTPQAESDLEFWKKSGLKSIQNRITRLLKEISETRLL